MISAYKNFELDDDCILPKLLTSDELFFPESSHFIHLRITLWSFDDCVRLLKQLGSQLRCFVVNLVFICLRERDTISQMSSICCPNMKKLTITNYRNTPQYEQCIVPLLKRLSTVEYLILFLAIGIGRYAPNHFIDGFDLDKYIISYLPNLHTFFRIVAQALPHLKSLETTTNSIEFTNLITLILCNIHRDYAEQLFCRSRVPHLVELLIHYEPLLAIVTDDQQQARINCSKIELIRIVESPDETEDLLNFFPNLYCKRSKKK
ncbi:hypothetical protein I4U23_015977 [Adineta vaga]|nr:hypothetical protein I4U23_015977 [Adineta vaga]